MGEKKTVVLVGIGICLLLTGGYLLRERLSGDSGEPPIEAAAEDVGRAEESPTKVDESVAGTEEEEVATIEAVDAAPRPAIIGTVRDSGGQPVEGARLVALNSVAWRTVFLEKGKAIWDSRGEQLDRTGGLRELHAEYRQRGAEFAATASGEDGAFRFTELAPGRRLGRRRRWCAHRLP